MIRAIATLTLLLALCLCAAAPAPASDLSLSAIGALDGGPTIGAALSYQVATVADLDLYADLGLKREEAGTAVLLGLSTPALPLLARVPLLGNLLGDDDYPSSARLGCGLLSSGEAIGYLAYTIQF